MSEPIEEVELEESEPMYAAPIGPTRPGEPLMYMEVGAEYDVEEEQE